MHGSHLCTDCIAFAQAGGEQRAAHMSSRARAHEHLAELGGRVGVRGAGGPFVALAFELYEVVAGHSPRELQRWATLVGRLVLPTLGQRDAAAVLVGGDEHRARLDEQSLQIVDYAGFERLALLLIVFEQPLAKRAVHLTDLGLHLVVEVAVWVRGARSSVKQLFHLHAILLPQLLPLLLQLRKPSHLPLLASVPAERHVEVRVHPCPRWSRRGRATAAAQIGVPHLGEAAVRLNKLDVGPQRARPHPSRPSPPLVPR
mmetsp:Transcript_11716/g.26856  ORF Transcript_11716/g.26856 Transcript_11716/m.26856 type:complete len:258 (+) Transcript_11716:442-1215(+)